jgi:gluconolactonase
MTTPFKEIASGLKFPEGPIAMPDGSVILVEIQAETLTRVTADGKKHVVAKMPGGPNGAAMGPGSKIYVTNNGGFTWHTLPDGRTFPASRHPATSAARSRRSTPRPARSRRSTTPATAGN